VRLDWLLLTAWQAVRRRVRRTPTRPPRVAGLMAVRDYDDELDAFAALARLSDVTIVLDDNSREPFPHRARCDHYLRLENHAPWNDQANRTLLMYQAFAHGCDWVVSIDHDLAFSHGFRTRDDVARLIAEMAAKGQEVCRFPVRELWESWDHWRADGVWGRKSIAVVRRNWFAYPAITLKNPARRLHTAAHPANLRQRLRMETRHVAYHAGCRTRAAREARVAKYAREDPAHEFQADYAYMLDDRGLELRPVPPEDVAVIDELRRASSRR
jgi:hypothetical protein